MEQVLFWGCWFATLGTTALLLLWSLPLSPFTEKLGLKPRPSRTAFYLSLGFKKRTIVSEKR